MELEHQPEARLTSVHLSNECIPKVRELLLVRQSDNWLKTIGVHNLEGVTEVVKINWSKSKSVKSRECVYFCLINYGDQCSHEISHWEANAEVSSSKGCFLNRMFPPQQEYFLLNSNFLPNIFILTVTDVLSYRRQPVVSAELLTCEGFSGVTDDPRANLP